MSSDVCHLKRNSSIGMLSSKLPLKAGGSWKIGVQHAIYTFSLDVDGETRESLLNDLD